MASKRKTVRSAKRRPSRAQRWITRLFWLGAVVLCIALWGERAIQPVFSASGYRRVESYAPLLRDVGGEFGLDPNLLAGVMLAESSGRVDAVSKVGALGLFQLMPPTARERAELLGLEPPSREELLSDAALNARLAGSYLRWLSRRYRGETEAALVAYNTGPGRLDGWIKEHGSYAAWRAARSGSSQVLDYARKVQAYAERFGERGVITPPSAPVPPSPLLPEPRPFGLAPPEPLVLLH